jgi:hypothetical protein
MDLELMVWFGVLLDPPQRGAFAPESSDRHHATVRAVHEHIPTNFHRTPVPTIRKRAELYFRAQIPLLVKSGRKYCAAQHCRTQVNRSLRSKDPATRQPVIPGSPPV